MSNPVLNDKMFDKAEAQGWAGAETMTVNGTINRAAILITLVIAAAYYTWNGLQEAMLAKDLSMIQPWIIGGFFGGFVLAIVTSFKPTIARFTSPVYAVCQGLFLGGVSAWANLRYPGIAFQAVLLTFAVFLFTLVLYRFEVIRPTQQFMMIVTAATGAVALLYLVSIGLSFFDIQVPLIHSNGLFGIGFSLVVVVLAALNLILDFAFIEQGESMGLPKHMEWYGAFGLLVTVVWLYLEILRLLMKLNSRR